MVQWTRKFESINSQLVNIKYDLTKNIEDNDSLSKVKDAIIKERRVKHFKLQQKNLKC